MVFVVTITISAPPAFGTELLPLSTYKQCNCAKLQLSALESDCHLKVVFNSFAFLLLILIQSLIQYVPPIHSQ